MNFPVIWIAGWETNKSYTKKVWNKSYTKKVCFEGRIQKKPQEILLA